MDCSSKADFQSAFQILGCPSHFYPEIVSRVGDLEAGILLSHILDWFFKPSEYTAVKDDRITVPVSVLETELLSNPSDAMDYLVRLDYIRYEVVEKPDWASKENGLGMCGPYYTITVWEPVVWNELFGPEARKDPHQNLDAKIDKRNTPENIRWLNSLRYKDYLATPHWEMVRRRALVHYEWTCALCGAHPGKGTKRVILHVHHRTYDNRGDESLNDVTVLCSDCHAKHHDVNQ